MKGQQEDRGSKQGQHNTTVARRPLDAEQQTEHGEKNMGELKIPGYIRRSGVLIVEY